MRYALLALSISLQAVVSSPVQAKSLVDPDRPLTTNACAEARAGLPEADRGSPILGVAENRVARMRARATRDRLCARRR